MVEFSAEFLPHKFYLWSYDWMTRLASRFDVRLDATLSKADDINKRPIQCKRPTLTLP